MHQASSDAAASVVSVGAQGLYLLLVTNKQSNILEDLEILRLLSKVVPMYVESLDEETIVRHAFDLLLAFDEVISAGMKENITAQQVKQNTDMESHEEKLHKMIIQSKINDTKDVMKRKAMEIEKTKVERGRNEVKSGISQFASSISSGMNSSGGMGGGGSGCVGPPSPPSVCYSPRSPCLELCLSCHVLLFDWKGSWS